MRTVATALREPHRRIELLGAFLRWRRAQMTRADVGLPPRRGARGGLTQEDLAELSGYAVRMIGGLEHGRLNNPSPHLLEAVARGLGLGEDERRTLWLLAAGSMPPPGSYVASPDAGLTRLVDLMYPHPAYVTDAVWNVQTYNAAVAEWFVDFGELAEADRNIAKWIFCDPHAQHVFVQWKQDFAAVFLARMRAITARLPEDSRLNALIDELCGRSPYFDHQWHAVADVYVDPPTETRLFRRPGYTDPQQVDDAQHQVPIDMVILGPLRPDDERRLVVFLLPPSESHRPHVLSSQACAVCGGSTDAA